LHRPIGYILFQNLDLDLAETDVREYLEGFGPLDKLDLGKLFFLHGNRLIVIGNDRFVTNNRLRKPMLRNWNRNRRNRNFLP
jgi:hypothetical protein